MWPSPLLVRVVAETAQHAGHADTLREMIDGRAGNDHGEVGDATWWARHAEARGGGVLPAGVDAMAQGRARRMSPRWPETWHTGAFPFLGERVDQQRERARHEQRRADAPHEPGDDQPVGAGRQRAGKRDKEEHAHPPQVGDTGADPVRHASGQQQQETRRARCSRPRSR